MRETKWTPGPWGWYIEDNSMAVLCGDGGHDPLTKHVMSVSPCDSCLGRLSKNDHWEWERCTTPALANAHLIAAAPELYEALRPLFEMVDHYEVEDDHFVYFKSGKGITAGDIRRAKAVAAKARGEQP